MNYVLLQAPQTGLKFHYNICSKSKVNSLVIVLL